MADYAAPESIDDIHGWTLHDDIDNPPDATTYATTYATNSVGSPVSADARSSDVPTPYDASEFTLGAEILNANWVFSGLQNNFDFALVPPVSDDMLVDAESNTYDIHSMEFDREWDELMSMGTTEMMMPDIDTTNNLAVLSFLSSVIPSHSAQPETEQRCPRCGITVGGQLYHLNRHMRSSRCHAKSNETGTYSYPDLSTRDNSPIDMGSSSSEISNAPSLWEGYGSGCPGALIHWGPGNIFTKFPWQIFAQTGLGFSLAHAEGKEGKGIIYLRSVTCNPMEDTGGEVCQACFEIRNVKFLERTEERAGLTEP